MFLLLTIRDVIEIEPAYFPKLVAAQTDDDAPPPPEDAPCQLSVDEILLHRLTERYVGHVVPGRGYCAAISSIVSSTPGVIRGHAGSSWSSVTFQAVIFRPHPNEKIRAVISSQSAEGIMLSLGFFDNIFIAAESLIHPGSSFDAERKVWTYSITNVDDEGGDPPTSPRGAAAPGGGPSSSFGSNDYQNGDEVLFAVKDVALRDVISAEYDEAGDDAPMKITGSFAGTGLGPCAWF